MFLVIFCVEYNGTFTESFITYEPEVGSVYDLVLPV